MFTDCWNFDNAMSTASAIANFYVTGGVRSIGILSVEMIRYYNPNPILVQLVTAFMGAGFAIFCEYNLTWSSCHCITLTYVEEVQIAWAKWDFETLYVRQ